MVYSWNLFFFSYSCSSSSALCLLYFYKHVQLHCWFPQWLHRIRFLMQIFLIFWSCQLCAGANFYFCQFRYSWLCQISSQIFCCLYLSLTFLVICVGCESLSSLDTGELVICGARHLCMLQFGKLFSVLYFLFFLLKKHDWHTNVKIIERFIFTRKAQNPFRCGASQHGPPFSVG